MQEEKNHDFTIKEVRGINLRNFAWLMTFFMAGVYCYFNIMGQLARLNNKINAIQEKINVLQPEVHSNTFDIKDIRQNVFPSIDNRLSVIEEELKDLFGKRNN